MMAYQKTTWDENTAVNVDRLQNIDDGIKSNDDNHTAHINENVSEAHEPVITKYREPIILLGSSGEQTMNANNSNVFKLNTSGDVSISPFTNITDAVSITLILNVTSTSHSVTFSGVSWSDGIEPIIDSQSVYLFTFFSYGEGWLGIEAGEF